ncbi:MAG: FMN-binding protein [Gammaproteobacteria bacterium]
MNGEPSIEPKRYEAGPGRLIVTLGLAGLLSGVAIVGAYEWTRPRIEANQAQALREAVFRVLPGVVSFQRWVYAQGELRLADPSVAGGRAIYAGCDRLGQWVGLTIPAEGAGFQDTIKLLFGYLPDERRIVGLEILESRETPGLGDRIYKDQTFLDNFRSLSTEPKITLVKSGTKGAQHEVDAITGATISAQAVVNIINAGLQEWGPRLSRGPMPSCDPVEPAHQPDRESPARDRSRGDR